jgi:hypothetical protein
MPLRFQMRCVVIAIGVLSLVAAQALATPSDCSALSSLEPPKWLQASDGIETILIPTFANPHIRDLILLRIDPAKYRFRVIDMRILAKRRQEQGNYAPPLYSLSELRGLMPNATIVSSAGFTRSLTNPDPAGYLKAAGLERAPVARRDRILDGVVCFSDVGAPSILSAVDEGGRKASVPLGQCAEGFQAGPVVVARTKAEIGAHQQVASRVVLGVDTQARLILGYSSMATTAALGCVLSAKDLQIEEAINVQGDEIGGLAFGRSISGALAVQQFGNTDSTVASALVIEPRSISTSSRPKK